MALNSRQRSMLSDLHEGFENDGAVRVGSVAYAATG
jgi:hypothetical protein